jgi:hypothetical protein
MSPADGVGVGVGDGGGVGVGVGGGVGVGVGVGVGLGVGVGVGVGPPPPLVTTTSSNEPLAKNVATPICPEVYVLSVVFNCCVPFTKAVKDEPCTTIRSV